MTDVVVTSKVDEKIEWVRAKCASIDHVIAVYSALKTSYLVEGIVRIYNDRGEEITEAQLIELFGKYVGVVFPKY